nr:hypothetical protein [Myxococcus xanthus]
MRGQVLQLEGERPGLSPQAPGENAARALRQDGEGGGWLEQSQTEERGEQVSAKALQRGLGPLKLLGREQPRRDQ